MLIERMRVTVKRGQKDAVLAILKEAPEARICHAIVGDNDVLVLDVEYKDMAAFSAEMEKRVSPEHQAALAEWFTLTTSVENELLLVVS